MIKTLLVRALSLTLSFTLVSTSVAGPTEPPQQAAKTLPAMDAAKLKSVLINVPTGSPLRVRTRDGAEIAGKLTEMNNDGIQIQALVDGNIESRSLAFGDIAGVKTGPKATGAMGKLRPLLTVLSLLGTVGAVTAAFKK